MLDQAQHDRTDAVPDGLVTSSHDDQFRRVSQSLQHPFGQLTGRHVPGATDIVLLVGERGSVALVQSSSREQPGCARALPNRSIPTSMS